MPGVMSSWKPLTLDRNGRLVGAEQGMSAGIVGQPLPTEGAPQVPITPSPFINSSTTGEAQLAAEIARQNNATGFQIGADSLGGFVSSALSSIPELFGADPSVQVEAYRARNPVMGFASEIAGTAVPYAGMYGLSKLPKFAAALETSTARGLGAFGVNAAEAPVRAGALKEILRYTPLELSRLGTGYTFNADNMGGMWADVGLSTVLAGAFGGFGGFLRRAGETLPETGRVLGAELGLLPTFELRMARQSDAMTSGDLTAAELAKTLRDDALDMTPQVPRSFGKSSEKYVYPIENGTEGAMGAINSMFKANSKATSKTGMFVRKLFEGPTANKATLNLGEQALVVESSGFGSIDELAETLVYPRLTELTSGRKAGQIARELSNAEGVMQLMDGTIVAKETDGLFLVMKPLSRGANKIKGAQIDVRNGDRWLIGKTDQIGKFMPEADKVFQSNVKLWSKMYDVYRPTGRTNIFDETGDAVQDLVSPTDFEAIRKGDKKYKQGFMGKIAQKLKDEAGIANSAQVKGIADKLYDWFAPTQFKEMKDSKFARLYGMWKVSNGKAEELARLLRVGTNELTEGGFKGVVFGKGLQSKGFFGEYKPYQEIVRGLSAKDLQLVHRAAITQTPSEDLAKLVASGDIGPAAVDAVEQLKKLNADVLTKLVLPALEDAGMANDFHWLKDYILPRVQRGSFYVQVKNEKGALQWLSTGVTGEQAQKEAKAIIKEAAESGQTWTLTDVEAFGLARKDINFADIQGLIYDKMALDQGGQDIAKRALRRMYAEQGLSQTGAMGRLSKPSSNVGFNKERSGIGASVDLADVTAEDFIGAMDSHYRQLLNLAAYATWHSRWGDEALRFSKQNPVMYTDLVRKVGVGLGFEGQLTQYINKGLSRIPGMGPRAGTQIASKANEILYAWNLGILNTSFAVLNALSPLQQVAPHVAYLLEAPNAKVAEMMQFVPHINAQGQVRGLTAAWDTSKIMQQSIRQMGNPDAALTEIQQRLLTDGALAPQLYDNFMGNSSPLVGTLKGAYEREGGWGFIKELTTTMATKSEQFGRLTSANAMYLVGKNHFNLEGEQLYRFVRRGIDMNMYGYGVADRARVMTGPLGSTFGLFKNWQFHFIGTMAKNAGLAMDEKIFGPLLWQGATAVAIGGIGGTPLKMLADGLANQYSENETAFQWLQENWNEPEFMGGRTSDAVYYGLPAFLGISLQSSATMPGTDIRNDLTSMSNVVLLERGKLIWQAGGEAIAYGRATGQNPFQNPDVRDAMFNALAPRAAIRAASVTEGEYIKSLKTGYPSIQDVSMASRILHATGFNALEIERHNTANRELWKDQEAQRNQVVQYSKAMSEAMAFGDYEEMDRLQRTAIIKGLPLDSIYRGAGTRNDREMGSNYDRYDAAKVADMQRILGE